jgi:hypothetical protein
MTWPGSPEPGSRRARSRRAAAMIGLDPPKEHDHGSAVMELPSGLDAHTSKRRVLSESRLAHQLPTTVIVLVYSLSSSLLSAMTPVLSTLTVSVCGPAVSQPNG